MLALVLLLAGGVAGWLIAQRPNTQAARALPVLGKAPRFHGLTNQLGERVDSSRFEGKVQVVTFLFPYCTTYCPLIVAHLAGLESTLKLAGLQDRIRDVMEMTGFLGFFTAVETAQEGIEALGSY